MLLFVSHIHSSEHIKITADKSEHGLIMLGTFIAVNIFRPQLTFTRIPGELPKAIQISVVFI